MSVVPLMQLEDRGSNVPLTECSTWRLGMCNIIKRHVTFISFQVMSR